jgi:hypothetical protein
MAARSYAKAPGTRSGDTRPPTCALRSHATARSPPAPPARSAASSQFLRHPEFTEAKTRAVQVAHLASWRLGRPPPPVSGSSDPLWSAANRSRGQRESSVLGSDERCTITERIADRDHCSEGRGTQAARCSLTASAPRAHPSWLSRGRSGQLRWRDSDGQLVIAASAISHRRDSFRRLTRRCPRSRRARNERLRPAAPDPIEPARLGRART